MQFKLTPQQLFTFFKGNKFGNATFWMTLGIMLMNAGSFFYIFILARFLNPSDYSILITAISIIGLITVPMNILQLVLVSMVSEAKGLGDEDKIRLIHDYFLKRIFWLSFFLLFFFLIFSKQINTFFHFDNRLYLVLVVFLAITYFFLIFFRAVLQGAFAFRKFSASAFWEMALRILVVVLVALLGFGLLGALGGFLVSQILVTLYTFFLLRFKLSNKPTQTVLHTSAVFKVVTPAAFMILGLTSFYTTDVLLVRHFFPEPTFGNDASLYAALSTLGKIIFFANFGIASALLPVATEKHTKKENSLKIFYASLALEILICTFFVGIYFLVPKLLLTLLGQKDYLQASNLLGFFAIFISLHSLVYLVSNYLFSTKRLLASYLVFLFAFSQVVGIYFFHQSLLQIIQVSTLISFGLLLVLLIYFLFISRKLR